MPNQESEIRVSLNRREFIKFTATTVGAAAGLYALNELGINPVIHAQASEAPSKQAEHQQMPAESIAKSELQPQTYEALLAAQSVQLDVAQIDRLITVRSTERAVPARSRVTLSKSEFNKLTQQFAGEDTPVNTLLEEVKQLIESNPPSDLAEVVLTFQQLDTPELTVSMSAMLKAVGESQIVSPENALAWTQFPEATTLYITAELATQMNAMRLSTPDGNLSQVFEGDTICCLTTPGTRKDGKKTVSFENVSALLYQKADGSIAEVSLNTFYLNNKSAKNVEMLDLPPERLFLGNTAPTEKLAGKGLYELVWGGSLSPAEESYLQQAILDRETFRNKKFANGTGRVEFQLTQDNQQRYILTISEYSISMVKNKVNTGTQALSTEKKTAENEYLLVWVQSQPNAKNSFADWNIAMVPTKGLRKGADFDPAIVIEQLNQNSPELVPTEELGKEIYRPGYIPAIPLSDAETGYFSEAYNFADVAINGYEVKYNQATGTLSSELSPALQQAVIDYQEQKKGVKLSDRQKKALLDTLKLPVAIDAFLNSAQIKAHFQELRQAHNAQVRFILAVDTTSQGVLACRAVSTDPAGKEILIEAFALDENQRIISVRPNTEQFSVSVKPQADEQLAYDEQGNPAVREIDFLTKVTPELQKTLQTKLGITVELDKFVLMTVVEIQLKNSKTGKIRIELQIQKIACDLNKDQISVVPQANAGAGTDQSVAKKGEIPFSTPEPVIYAMPKPEAAPARWEVSSKKVTLHPDLAERVANNPENAITMFGWVADRSPRGDNPGLVIIDEIQSPRVFQENILPIIERLQNNNASATFLNVNATSEKDMFITARIGKLKPQVQVLWGNHGNPTPEMTKLLGRSVDLAKVYKSKAMAQLKGYAHNKYVRAYDAEKNIVTIFVLDNPGQDSGSYQTGRDLVQALEFAFAGDSNDQGNAMLMKGVKDGELLYMSCAGSIIGFIGKPEEKEAYEKYGCKVSF